MGVEVRYSGGPGNKFAITSIGGAMSSEIIPDAVLQNLFDDVSRVEVINGRTEHRCFFITNTGAQDYYRSRLITLVIPSGTEMSYAADELDVPQLLETEDSTPVGLGFFRFDEWTSLQVAIGQLDIGKKIAIWLRRKVLVGNDDVQTISLIIDAKDNALTPTGDFNSIESSLDNDFIKSRSPLYFTDIDFVGESLLN